MRDNARRLPTILTVILACGWCWASGRCPSATGDLQSVHPAGGRRGAHSVNVRRTDQPSAIGNRPAEDFRGRWFWSAGIPTVLFPERSAHGETVTLVSQG